MNTVRVVKNGPEQGVYINGVKVPGVLKIEPDLFGTDSLAVARITIAIDHFELESGASK